MVRRWSRIALAWTLIGGWTGCGSDSRDASSQWDDLPSYEDKFPPSCAALTSLVEFVYENKACAVDADCVHVQSCLAAKDLYSGGFYLNKQHDAAKMYALQEQAATCPLYHGCSAFSPFPGGCSYNRCFATLSIEGSSACLSMMGDTNDCALCLCMEDGKNATACLFDSKCAPIFHCAVKAGCYGTLACDLAALDFPCKPEVDAAGGPKSETAELYRISNARAPGMGCQVPCAIK